MNNFFVTGTDTEIGKTFVSCLLLKSLNACGYKTFAIKPLASGCVNQNGQRVNEDALKLQSAVSIKKPYSLTNPIALSEPIAPHIAAVNDGVFLSKTKIKKALSASIVVDADINLIEGIGGWSVPLNDHELFCDVINELNIPVILVVGIRLGCLNHALLTYQEMLAQKTSILGWIANCLSPETQAVNENINTLKVWLKTPCLGVVGYNNLAISQIDTEVILARLRFFNERQYLS